MAKSLAYEQMVPDVRYIVKRASDDGTFKRLDKVTRHHDGDVRLVAGGFYGVIASDRAAKATKGMRVIVDSVWAHNRIQDLRCEIERLESAYGVEE